MLLQPRLDPRPGAHHCSLVLLVVGHAHDPTTVRDMDSSGRPPKSPLRAAVPPRMYGTLLVRQFFDELGSTRSAGMDLTLPGRRGGAVSLTLGSLLYPAVLGVQKVSSTPSRVVAHPATGPLTAADRDFVVKVRAAGLWEYPVGEKALKKGTTKAVRSADTPPPNR